MMGYKNEYKKVINGYKIHSVDAEGTQREERLKDITIVFLCNGQYFAESQYKKVSEVKLKKLEERLFDNTVYNLNVEFQCQAISLPTLIYQIDDIILNRK